LGQQWSWELLVPDSWANAAWAVWKGNMVVKYHYKATRTRTIATAFGKLTCQEVMADARCEQGSSTLRTLFHPTYGFVTLEYSTIDGQKLRLQLSHVETSSVYKWDILLGNQQ
ncbi:MAG TPA: hypothetical protein VF598_10570, partial [Hymenobacter sp.]